MRLSAREILSACADLEPELVQGEPETVFNGLSTDSRTVAPGQLFVALKGERFDGHDFVFQALKRGAAGALVDSAWADGALSKEDGQGIDQAVIIATTDSLTGLGRVGRHWRLKFSAPVLAISGSIGKSTVKEMAASILAVSRRVRKNQGNLNNLIGLPLTLATIDQADQTVVVELGVNQPGEMERLADMARPEAALLTNIAPVHLEGLGDMAGVARAKTALWRALTPQGRAVVNLDDPFLAAAGQEFSGPKITFGSLAAGVKEADVILVSAQPAGAEGLDLELAVRGMTCRTRIQALGHVFQGQNATAACAGALALGAGVEDMVQGLSRFQQLDHRMRLLKGRGGLVVLDDAYNANPLSMTAALKTLRQITPAQARAGAILGQMAELGSQAEAAHQALGQEAARAELDLLIALGPWAKTVLSAAKKAGLKETREAQNQTQAADLVLSLLGRGDVVLVKGSRVAGLEQTVALLTGGGHGA
ncbi:MAG: UDP-N-acetylmuramoyl-tripeptide--D-alanyl-D-alanine ligase [Deltaproteobacteria bacterium]|nr:UDP-N-acetylmuramoyl-tripeptide--D-alanyl-D-alanine ligase [Deltaproteobacteria bacterium]